MGEDYGFICRIKCLLFFACLLFAIVSADGINLAGDRKSKEEAAVSTTGFAFDTTYTITMYEGGDEKISGACVKLCAEYEKIFSRTKKSSELFELNEISDVYRQAVENSSLHGKWERAVESGNFSVAYTQEEQRQLEDKVAQALPEGISANYSINAADGSLSVTVSEQMAELLQKGLDYSSLSEGKFDITVEPVSSLWNFTAERPEVPDDALIQKRLDYIGYERVQLKGNRVRLLQPGIGIDLGGIAKGYIADCLKQFLQEEGVTSAIINLGGNILCIGGKPDGSPFSIGVQQPFADRNETAAAVSVKNASVVSSGTYERYFLAEDGTMYHHILNPETGYPYQTDIVGVTIVSDTSVSGDGLSTTCFALGAEKGIELIDSMENTYAIFITADGKLHYSAGCEQFLL